MMNSWKSYIDDQLVDTKVSTDLFDRIMESTEYGQKKIRRKPLTMKYIAISLLVCFGLMGSITAFGASVPAINNWIYAISPSLAERLYPVNQSASDKGIKMEVLSAVNDAHNAIVYFSLQDLTDNRIDETTDLYNYILDGPFSFNCQMLSYEEKDHKAIFQLTGAGGDNMANKLSTLYVSSFMSNKKEYDWFDTKINLTDIADRRSTSVPISEYQYTGGNEANESLPVLKADQMELSLGENIDFVSISNMGVVDGKLHVQTKWKENIDNHGQLKLIGADGTEIQSNNYYFKTDTDTESGDKRSTHIEYVFDIPNMQYLKTSNLQAKLTEDGDYISGNWRVQFRLKNSDTKRIVSEKEAADIIEISDLGIYFTGFKGNVEDDEALVVILKNGEKLEFGVWSTSSDVLESGKRHTNVSALFEYPVNVKEIESVTLNGKTLYKS